MDLVYVWILAGVSTLIVTAVAFGWIRRRRLEAAKPFSSKTLVEVYVNTASKQLIHEFPDESRNVIEKILSEYRGVDCQMDLFRNYLGIRSSHTPLEISLKIDKLEEAGKITLLRRDEEFMELNKKSFQLKITELLEVVKSLCTGDALAGVVAFLKNLQPLSFERFETKNRKPHFEFGLLSRKGATWSLFVFSFLFNRDATAHKVAVLSNVFSKDKSNVQYSHFLASFDIYQKYIALYLHRLHSSYRNHQTENMSPAEVMYCKAVFDKSAFSGAAK